MPALSFLDLGNQITPQVMTLLHYFAKDTTERIIKNAQRLKVGSALRSSIEATVYNNAGGNDALIRFYYLNYAGYLEEGLGYIRGVDNDLTEYLKSGKVKRHGVKARNVVPIDPITGSNFSSIPATIRKPTKSPTGDARRGEAHKAKPFLHSEIRLHLRSTQKRLAMLLGYTATAYLLRGMVQSTMQLVEGSHKGDYNEQLNKLNKDYALDEIPNGSIKSGYTGVHFEADMKAEDAWLKAKGYLQHIERDWGLSSFRAEDFKF